MERNDLPYERGDIITDTGDDVRKLQVAWKHMADRQARLGADAIHRLSGLERSLQIDPAELAAMDDDLAPAYCMETLTELALEHMGGDPAVHDFMLFNRQTAALIVAAEILLAPGDTVIGVSPSYSHPAVTRAVARAGATFVDTCGLAAFREALDASQDVAVVMLTRLAVTYEILPQRDLDEIVRLAKRAGARIIVDDAGGARVGPAMFGQAKSLELGVDIASTGLDKYGTVGPRLGLLAGDSGLVAQIRARAFELGMEARPMLYPAVVHSLSQYRPERVRELVDCTKQVAAALKARIGSNRVWETEVIAQLRGEDVLELAMARAGLEQADIVPCEATAALAMLLLRDHGIFTVHFAGLPPGTSALMIKFIAPELLERLGGAEVMADAINASIDALGALLGEPDGVRRLLFDA